MTLDPGRSPSAARVGECAVVIGASVSGMLAARVLSEHFARVVLVERDALADVAEARRGVPQSRHVHALLARAAVVLEELFPGFLDELTGLGAPALTDLAEIYFAPGRRLFHDGPGPLSFRGHLASRPLIEQTVRRRVRALANVEFLDATEASALQAADPGRVTGVVVHRSGRDARTLQADLVVDCTGRGGRAETWLRELGHRPPVRESVEVDIRYVSRLLRLQPGMLGRKKLLVLGAGPGMPSGLALMLQENDTWILTAWTYRDHSFPVDGPGLLDFVRGRVPGFITDAVKAAEPLSEPVQYRYPASTRRRYERLPGHPVGLVIFGDALCSFNPIYGQGMAVAAQEALLLRQALVGGSRGLAGRFYNLAAAPIDVAWDMAANGDLALPEVPGSRTARIRLLNCYVERFHAAAAHDPVLVNRFLAVTGLVEHPRTLVTPDTLRRVLAANLTGTRERLRRKPAGFPEGQSNPAR